MCFDKAESLGDIDAMQDSRFLEFPLYEPEQLSCRSVAATKNLCGVADDEPPIWRSSKRGAAQTVQPPAAVCKCTST